MPEQAFDREAWARARRRLDPRFSFDASGERPTTEGTIPEGLIIDELNHEPVVRLARAFGTGDRFKKALLIGQRGCGKSTVLHRLMRDGPLTDRNRLIRFSIFDALNLLDIEAVDILLMIYLHLLRAVGEEGLSPPSQGPEPVLAAMAPDFGADPLGADFVNRVSFRFKTDSRFRTKIRNRVKAEIESVQERITALCRLFSGQVRDCFMLTDAAIAKLEEEEVSEKILARLKANVYVEYKSEVAFLRMLEDEIGDIQTRHYQSKLCEYAWLEIPRDPLFLIDDADQLGRADIDRVFARESHLLTAMQAGILFAFPLFAVHLASFSRMEGRFEAVYLRPAFQGTNEEASPGVFREKMAELIRRRMDSGMIAEDALEHLIAHSGGMAGTLIGLVRDGCRLAVREGASVLDRRMAEALIDNYGKRFRRLFDVSQWADRARAIVESPGEKPESGESARLFRHNVVLEYQTPGNGIRCAIHPGLQRLLNET